MALGYGITGTYMICVRLYLKRELSCVHAVVVVLGDAVRDLQLHEHMRGEKNTSKLVRTKKHFYYGKKSTLGRTLLWEIINSRTV